MKTSPKTSKPATARPMKDLKPKKDPKGGAIDSYLFFNSQKQGSVKG